MSELTRKAKVVALIDGFVASAPFKRLTPNQQRYARNIVVDALKLVEGDHRWPEQWTAPIVTTLLTQTFPRHTDEDRHFYVAVVPVLDGLLTYVNHQTAIPNLAAVRQALRDSRHRLLTASRFVDGWALPGEYAAVLALFDEPDEEADALPGEVFDWLSDMNDHQREVQKLDGSAWDDFETAVIQFSTMAIQVRGVEPEAWTTELLDGILLDGGLLLLMDEAEQTRSFFESLAKNLAVFFGYLNQLGRLPQVDQLTGWLQRRQADLVALYNPAYNRFYREVTTAMLTAGIDITDQAATDAFTQQYLHDHPEMGLAALTSQPRPVVDAQLPRSGGQHASQRPAYRRRRKRRRRK